MLLLPNHWYTGSFTMLYVLCKLPAKYSYLILLRLQVLVPGPSPAVSSFTCNSFLFIVIAIICHVLANPVYSQPFQSVCDYYNKESNLRENENMSAQRMKKPENCPSCNCQFICSLSGESQDIKCLSWFQWATIQF